MALPTKDKTWQYSNNVAKGNTGTVLGDSRAVVRQFKTAMIGFGTLPWTVQGSSDSSTSGMDAVDRWDTDAKLVWAAGAHSWIVLRQTGIAAKFEVCFDLNNGTSTNLTVVVSGSAGFGTANGGTNGTTSARPTATDEVVIQNAGPFNEGPSVTNQYQVHVQQSTDGQCTRIIVTLNQVAVSFAIFDKPKNPISVWTTPWVAGWKGSNTAATIANWNDTANLRFKPSGSLANGDLFLGTTFVVSSSLGERTAGQVAHDVAGGRAFLPISLISETVPLRGSWGEMFDIYWGDTVMQKATQFDATPSHEWTYFQHLIVPWDGSTAVS